MRLKKRGRPNAAAKVRGTERAPVGGGGAKHATAQRERAAQRARAAVAAGEPAVAPEARSLHSPLLRRPTQRGTGSQANGAAAPGLALGHRTADGGGSAQRGAASQQRLGQPPRA